MIGAHQQERGPPQPPTPPYSLDVPYRANLAATESPRLRQVSKEQRITVRNDVGAVKITRLPLRPRPGGRHRVSPAPLKCRGFMICDRAGRELLPRTSRDCRRQIVSPPTWSALLIEDRRRNRPVERSAPERRSAIESTCRLQSRRYLTERPRAISGLRHSSWDSAQRPQEGRLAERQVSFGSNLRCPHDRVRNGQVRFVWRAARK